MKDKAEAERIRNLHELIQSAQGELGSALKRHREAIKALEKDAIDTAEGNEKLILATLAMTFTSGAVTLEREIRNKNEKELQELGRAIDEALIERQKLFEKLMQLASQATFVGLTSILLNLLLVALPLMAAFFPSLLSSPEWKWIFLALILTLGVCRFAVEVFEITRAQKISAMIQSDILHE